MTPEGRIKKKVSERLKAFGKDVWKFMPVQTGMGIPGLDYHLCVCGWSVFIETKASAKHDLTPRQKQTRATIQEAGGLVFVVYDDETLETAMTTISRIVSYQSDLLTNDLLAIVRQ